MVCGRIPIDIGSRRGGGGISWRNDQRSPGTKEDPFHLHVGRSDPHPVICSNQGLGADRPLAAIRLCCAFNRTGYDGSCFRKRAQQSGDSEWYLHGFKFPVPFRGTLDFGSPWRSIRAGLGFPNQFPHYVIGCSADPSLAEENTSIVYRNSYPKDE